MAVPDNSSTPPDVPLGAAPGSTGKLPSKAFMRALEAYQKGSEANNVEQMEAGAMGLLAIAGEEAERNPSPEYVLQRQGEECEARGDWTGAEGCYREVLKLGQESGNHGRICTSYHHLIKLFLLIGDVSRADECAQLALVSARESQIFQLQVMAHQQKAACSMNRGDYAAALQTAEEALAVIEPGRRYDSMRAGAWVTRARCRLACGDLAGCQSDLAAARPILVDAAISPIFAGLHSSAAAWWETTARSRAGQGDSTGACEAWSEAVQRRRHVNSLSHVTGPHTLAALAKALRGLAQALDAAGQTGTAKTPHAEAQRIWHELGVPEPRSF